MQVEEQFEVTERYQDAFVSVIVPVFNDLAGLSRCLSAIARQSLSTQQFEVIVVDNASGNAAAIAALTEQYAFTKYIYAVRPGSYAARNAGLEAAKGGFLAFTDADCVPDRDWLLSGLQALVDCPDCGLIAGQIDVFARGDRANPIELYEQVTAFPQQQLLQQFHGGATANVFTRRAVVDTVGKFNAALKSQGDLEWGQRVYEAGFEQRYAPKAVVAHPARHTLAQLTTRSRRLAGGAFYRQIQAHRYGLVEKLVAFAQLVGSDLLPPVNFAVSALRNRQLKTLSDKVSVVAVLMWVRLVSAVEKVRLFSGHSPVRS